MEKKECTVKKSSRIQKTVELIKSPDPNLSGGISYSQESFNAETARCLGTHRCEGCGICTVFCPDSCITYVMNGGITINYDSCKGCGICAAICPKGAIEMTLEEVEG